MTSTETVQKELDLVDVDELVRIFDGRISAFCFYDLARDGKIPCIHIKDRVLFERDEVIAWVKLGGTVLKGQPKPRKSQMKLEE